MNQFVGLSIILLLLSGCISMEEERSGVVYKGRCANAKLAKLDLTDSCKGKFTRLVTSDGVHAFRFFFSGMDVRLFGDLTLTGGSDDERIALDMYQINEMGMISGNQAGYMKAKGVCSRTLIEQDHQMLCDVKFNGEDRFIMEFVIEGNQ